MKILMIDESINRVGGVERVISVLANKLNENNKIDVISEYKSSTEPFYEYNSSVNITYLIDSQKYKSASLKDKNLLYYFFRLFEKINDKMVLGKRIKHAVADFDHYDVIVFGRVFTAIDFLKHEFVKNGNTKIIVRDAIHLEYYSKHVQRQIKKIFPKYVDTFVVSSNESIKAYENFFGNFDVKMRKIYNPLGIVPNKGFDFDSKTIVSIGRLDSQKGYENLIKAYKIVSDKHKDWKLNIYGDGVYYSKLYNLIKKLDLKDNVRICPSTKNVVEVFNSSSIFVLPSRYEGYANVLVEALACGIPSVSYNWLMGVEEIINDGINGYVVPLQNRFKYFHGYDNDCDSQNLAEKIEYLINNETICKKFSNESVKIINSRIIDAIIKEWMELIN